VGSPERGGEGGASSLKNPGIGKEREPTQKDRSQGES